MNVDICATMCIVKKFLFCEIHGFSFTSVLKKEQYQKS